MKRRNLERAIGIILVSAFMYFIFDIPVRMTEFLNFLPFVGIKCLIAVICGYLFGVCGAVGCSMSAFVSNMIFQSKVLDTIYESFICLFIGIVVWLLWYAVSRKDDLNLKTPKKLLVFIGLTTGVSAICGMIGLLFGGILYFLQTLIAYSVLGVFVGIPVLTICTSIVCVKLVLPPWVKRKKDLEIILRSASDLIILNDSVDELSFTNKTPMKRTFELQNCIEESAVRIWDNDPNLEIYVRINLSDSFSLYMRYQGEKYNPIKKRKNEDRDSVIGLLLIRARALRVGHSYRYGENHLNIVL